MSAAAAVVPATIVFVLLMLETPILDIPFAVGRVVPDQRLIYVHVPTAQPERDAPSPCVTIPGMRDPFDARSLGDCAPTARRPTLHRDRLTEHKAEDA